MVSVLTFFADALNRLTRNLTVELEELICHWSQNFNLTETTYEAERVICAVCFKDQSEENTKKRVNLCNYLYSFVSRRIADNAANLQKQS